MSAYEFDPGKYRQASSHQKDWGNRLIDELDLHGDEKILDLGCGDGTLTARLAALVPNGGVVGIDASVPMIEAAKPLETPNLKFLCRDIDDLDFVHGFDVVFSNAALHWVRDHDRLLRNVHQALKQEGVARFNFAGDGNCSNFFAVVRELMASEIYSRYFEAFLWPWYMPTVDAYEEKSQVHRTFRFPGLGRGGGPFLLGHRADRMDRTAVAGPAAGTVAQRRQAAVPGRCGGGDAAENETGPQLPRDVPPHQSAGKEEMTGR